VQPKERGVSAWLLTKNVEATEFEHKRFLRGCVQLVAHFFQTPDSFQDFRRLQLRCDFLCRLCATFEHAFRRRDPRAQNVRPPEKSVSIRRLRRSRYTLSVSAL